MFLRAIVSIALSSLVRSQNIEVRDLYPIYLRDGGSSDGSVEPTYAGYSFDVTMKSGEASILVGQPREGVPDSNASSGAIYYCDVTFNRDFRSEESAAINTTEGPVENLDIIFVFDGSRILGTTNFAKVQEWLYDVIRSLKDKYGDSVRTAVLQYSNNGFGSTAMTIPYSLNENLTVNQSISKIREMTFLGHSRYTANGLTRATEVEFRKSLRYPFSKRVLVALTHGPAMDREGLVPWWEKHGKTGDVIPIAIGVTGSVLSELKTIANGGAGMERVLTGLSYDNLATIVPNLTSIIDTAAVTEAAAAKYIKPNCTHENIFDPTNRGQVGAFHDSRSDALGLNLGTIGDTGTYAVCMQGRQKACPDKMATSPGACYFGNPAADSWEFMKREESKCFEEVLDIIFVVDGSKSITAKNFDIVRQWLINATEILLETYGDAARTEVLQYSNKDPDFLGISVTASNKFVIPYKLNDGLTLDEMKGKILKMRYLAESTYTKFGLDRAVRAEFPQSDQNDVSKKVVIVLTDGKADDSPELSDWWKAYGATGKIIPFAIGVADYERPDLQMIANGGKNNNNVFTVDNFSGLSKILSSLTNSIATAVASEGQSANTVSAANSTNNRQMGSSITSLEDGSIHFGSVGMYLDSGSVMRFDDTSDTAPDAASYEAVKRALPDRTSDSYLGYASTPGYFNGRSNGEYIAAGAPRYNLKGAVVVYDPSKDPYMSVSATILPPNDDRDQVASYFGGCLLSVDVNNDGFDELFVASPLFVGQNNDEGRVSVYIGSGSNSTAEWSQKSYIPLELSGDKSPLSRFGSAMAAAGDLNIDGFQDIIIGAPLADQGSGAIFIYYGMSTGISAVYNQRIRASGLSGARLQYFGQSVKGNIDVDRNGYPDIFVGAPRSDSIVLLKSRSIARIMPRIEFLQPAIDIFQCIDDGYKNCATVQVCFLANGTEVETFITITYTVTLDPSRSSRSRAVFDLGLKNILSETLPLQKERWHCRNHTMRVTATTVDFNAPLEAKVEVELSANHTNSPMSSIIDSSSDTVEYATIGWKKDCENVVCVSDLRLNVQLELPKFEWTGQTNTERTLVISSTTAGKSLRMTASISNEGENSFSTKLKVTHPSTVSIQPARTINNSASLRDCVKEDGTPTTADGMTVQLYRYSSPANVMKSKSKCSFELLTIADDLRKTSSLENFNVTFHIYSESTSTKENDTTREDNTWNVSIPIRYVSGYALRSEIGETLLNINYTEPIAYNITSIEQIGRNTSAIEVDVKITANGHSNIPTLNTRFTYPSWLIENTHPLLYLYELECPSVGGETRCDCDESYVDIFGLSRNNSRQSKGSVDKGYFEMTPLTVDFSGDDIRCPKTGVNSNYTCNVISCNISNLYSTGEVHFKAKFRLWTDSIMGIYNDTNMTFLTMKSNFKISAMNSPLLISQDGGDIAAQEQDIVVIANKFIEQIYVVTADLSWLWYVLGCSGGAIILLVVAITLYKKGFFKNKYSDKLQSGDLDDEINMSPEDYEIKKEDTTCEIPIKNEPGVTIAVSEIQENGNNSSQTNASAEYWNFVQIAEESSPALQDCDEPDYVVPEDDEPDYDEPPDE